MVCPCLGSLERNSGMTEQSKVFYTELASIVEDFTCLLLLMSLSGTCKLNFQLNSLAIGLG